MALPSPLPPQYTLLTAVGASKLSTALANGTTVDFKEFAAGDGGGSAYIPTVNAGDYATQIALINEVYRADLDSKSIDAADNTIAKLTAKIPLSHSTSFTIREIGLYDTSGDLIAITIVPDQNFSAGLTDIYINSAIQISNTAVVNLTVTNALFANLSELENGVVNNKAVAPDVLKTYLDKTKQSYDASTNTPDIALMLNGSEVFVETKGTQIINGEPYDLEKGDVIKKSNVGTLSVFRGKSAKSKVAKSANYALLAADLPEDEIIGLNNTSGASIDFTVPATYATDTQSDYVDATKTIITVEAGQTIYVRNTQGNVIELIGSDYDPDYASNLDALTQTVTNKALVPSNLPAMTASNLEAKGMTALNKFLTPSNLSALKAVLTDISDTVPLDNKLMTDKHLVDWFISGGRINNSVGSGKLIFTLPGGYKFWAIRIGNPALAAAQPITTYTYNFPVGLFTAPPSLLSSGTSKSLTSLVTSVDGLIEQASATATQFQVYWSNYLGTAGLPADSNAFIFSLWGGY